MDTQRPTSGQTYIQHSLSCMEAGKTAAAMYAASTYKEGPDNLTAAMYDYLAGWDTRAFVRNEPMDAEVNKAEMEGEATKHVENHYQEPGDWKWGRKDFCAGWKGFEEWEKTSISTTTKAASNAQTTG